MINPYYLHVNLPITVDFTKDLAFYARTGRYLHSELREPKEPLESWLASLGITVIWRECFYRPIGSGSRIHIDGALNSPDIVKLNFVIGQGSSHMLWHQIKDTSQLTELKTPAVTDYVLAEASNCYPVDRCRLDSPTLINARHFHSVESVDQTRWCFSFSLQHSDPGNLTWSRAVELFSPWAVLDPQSHS